MDFTLTTRIAICYTANGSCSGLHEPFYLSIYNELITDYSWFLYDGFDLGRISCIRRCSCHSPASFGYGTFRR